MKPVQFAATERECTAWREAAIKLRIAWAYGKDTKEFRLAEEFFTAARKLDEEAVG